MEGFGFNARSKGQGASFSFDGADVCCGIHIANLRLDGFTTAGGPIAFHDTRDATASVQEEREGLFSARNDEEETTIGVGLPHQGEEIGRLGRAPIECIGMEVKGKGEGIEEVHADDAVNLFDHHATDTREV